MPASIHFRDDINALRALAVIAVVLFHYKVNIFRGGYAGVDIFFVISGYLMTAIILRRLETNTFSLTGFYKDRARRIIPPLVGLILTLSILGYFFIDPPNYQKLAASGVTALLFFSNVSFWAETGYFDPGNDTKWFLHTWSLSVEWQFYLLYPILLAGLYRFTKDRRSLAVVISMIALASLTACICVSRTDPSASFYLLPFRAWELLAGGIVALRLEHLGAGSKRLCYLLLVTGFALIFFALFAFDKTTPWPSFWALLPVTGTCFVIAARQTETPVFANPLCRSIGKWSYSTYLWHWPLAVGAHYIGFAKTTPLKIAAEIIVLAIIIGLGGTLWQKALNYWKESFAPHSVNWRAPAAVAVFLLALVFDIFINRAGGLADRAANGPRLVETYLDAKSDFAYPRACDGLDRRGDLQPCRMGQSDGSGKNILVIGDSQAMQIYPHFTDTLARKTNASFTFLAAHGCPPMLGLGRMHSNPECPDFMDKAFATAESGNYNRVLLISRWLDIRDAADLETALTHFSKRLESLRQRGATVVIVSATGVLDIDVPQDILRRKFFGYALDNIRAEDRNTFEKQLATIKPKLKWLAAASGADFVDPLDYLCTRSRCAMIDDTEDSLFWDKGHYRGKAVQSPLFAFLDDIAGLTEPNVGSTASRTLVDAEGR